MKVYIAGPMTGYPELNYPAFMEAARTLRGFGHTVVNPAELNPQDTPYVEAMKRDIKGLLECDGLFMLSGWQASKGATLEYHIAKVLQFVILGDV